MGLIKAAVGALSGTLGDTWKRPFTALLSATILLLLTARRCTTVMQEAVT